MAEHTQPRRFDIVEFGPIAARALRQGANGTVRAVFERSFYAVFDGQWICFGASGIESGPLNAIYASATTTMDRTRALPSVGDRAVVRECAVDIDADLCLSVAGARPWRAPGIGYWNAASLARGLASLHRSIAGALPEDGLAPLLADDRPAISLSRIAAAAIAPSRHLEAMIAARRRDARIDGSDVRPLTALLGLGPGLTPSGDDFIGGAMISLHALGCGDLRDCIWSEIESQARDATNEISRPHLQAAAEGLGAAALHELIGAVMTGNAEAIAASISAIDDIGHTSGWDALTGAVVVLRAWSGVKMLDRHVSAGMREGCAF